MFGTRQIKKELCVIKGEFQHFLNKISNYEDELRILSAKVNKIYENIDKLNSKIKLEEQKIKLEEQYDVEIDFDEINVFSIERINSQNDHDSVTIIGHIMNDMTKEWKLYISLEQHNELVKKFRKWKASKVS